MDVQVFQSFMILLLEGPFELSKSNCLVGRTNLNFKSPFCYILMETIIWELFIFQAVNCNEYTVAISTWQKKKFKSFGQWHETRK